GSRRMSPFAFTPLAGMDAAARGAKGEDRLNLSRVDGAQVPGGTLRVLLGPKIVGKRYFRLQRTEAERQVRFVEALYNDGPYPGHNWVEIFDMELPEPLRGREHFAPDLEPYLRPVADAIPAGGHMMAEYEKLDWHTTQRGLLAGIPPIATPLGALLFALGVGDSFKDWYFPEGGMEGSRKLQGNKAYTAPQRVEMHRKRAEELRRFLATPAQGPLEIDRRARDTAAIILHRLGADA
ncbi:MAG TPA: DUF1122 family protein, partial [Candidatus Dormibacteraeota bacterium]|nr:DUF1122 family protein [Candidatus Dormibacteraeota bacterium]